MSMINKSLHALELDIIVFSTRASRISCLLWYGCVQCCPETTPHKLKALLMSWTHEIAFAGPACEDLEASSLQLKMEGDISAKCLLRPVVRSRAELYASAIYQHEYVIYVRVLAY